MTILLNNMQENHDTQKIEEIIKEVINKTLEVSKIDYECQVSVSLVDNEKIREINKTYRNIDFPTDVLSFPLLEFQDGKMLMDYNENEVRKMDVIDNDTGEILLGDIVISIDKAYEQSDEYGHSFEREIAYLTVHGMLHLMGYDHENENDRFIMREREEEILSLINKKR